MPLVLVANAQEWVSRSLESILRPAGYAVLKAYSGRDALEGAHRGTADVIILDSALPETCAGRCGWTPPSRPARPFS